jgi:hypothetical protein
MDEWMRWPMEWFLKIEVVVGLLQLTHLFFYFFNIIFSFSAARQATNLKIESSARCGMLFVVSLILYSMKTKRLYF